MMKTIGIDFIDELFQDIPHLIRVPPPTDDDGLSEYEGIQLMETIAACNKAHTYDCYLGGGAYEHHIPSLANAICQKSEFLTAYTPYQPETSQGMLQIIFEFQSAICALTGMDVANASLYDGASACAEAILMSLRHNKLRNKILISGTLNPHYRRVIDQYLNGLGGSVLTIPLNDQGELDLNFIETHLDDSTACLLLQTPNFFGNIEDVKPLFTKAKAAGVLCILCANPLSYGLFSSAGKLQADIAVGDCQSLGIPLQYGGPYAGYIACRADLVRQMPGRIVGETVDTKGRRGFVLTLQAREQHIRREKATSNICTNQTLMALASLVTMLWYGPEGLRNLALTNYQRAAYLRNQLTHLPHVRPFNNAPHFNEFAIHVDTDINPLLHKMKEEKIEPGINLQNYFPQYPNTLLITVTETKNKEQLDKYIDVFKGSL